jgi:hypothetical protein
MMVGQRGFGLCVMSVAIACGSDDAANDAGSVGGSADGTSGTANGSSSADGPDSADGPSSADEASGSADESGDPPDACPGDADLSNGMCPAQGASCSHGDFVCDCVCACDEGDPGQPGFWQCDHPRARELVALKTASVSIDCDGGTIATTASFVVDNTQGSSPLEFTMLGSFSYALTNAEVELAPCGGICPDGCDDLAPIVVAPGTTESLNREFPATMCSDEQTQAALCSFCDGSARLTVQWRLAGDGIEVGEGNSFEDLPIACP